MPTEWQSGDKPIEFIKKFLKTEQHYLSFLKTLSEALEKAVQYGGTSEVLAQLPTWNQKLVKLVAVLNQIIRNQETLTNALTDDDKTVTTGRADKDEVTDRSMAIIATFFQRKEEYRLYHLYALLVREAGQLLSQARMLEPAVDRELTEIETAYRWRGDGVHGKLLVPIKKIYVYTSVMDVISDMPKTAEERRSGTSVWRFFSGLSLIMHQMENDFKELELQEFVEKRIFGMNLLDRGCHLSQFGRFLMSGILEVRNENTEQQAQKRMVFVFQMLIIIGDERENLPGEEILTCTFNRSLPMTTYGNISYDRYENTFKVWSNMPPYGTPDAPDVWFFRCKDAVEMQKWTSCLIKTTMDHNQTENNAKGHQFRWCNIYDGPTACEVCRQVIGGLIMQGCICMVCHMHIHRDCRARLTEGQRCFPKGNEKILQSYAWYVGSMNRMDVGKLLLSDKLGGYGDFLVSYDASEQYSGYVLSVRYGKQVKHLEVHKSDADNKYYIHYPESDDDKHFKNIVALVQYYRNHNLRINLGGHVNRLIQPSLEIAREMVCCVKNIKCKPGTIYYPDIHDVPGRLPIDEEERAERILDQFDDIIGLYEEGLEEEEESGDEGIDNFEGEVERSDPLSPDDYAGVVNQGQFGDEGQGEQDDDELLQGQDGDNFGRIY